MFPLQSSSHLIVSTYFTGIVIEGFSCGDRARHGELLGLYQSRTGVGETTSGFWFFKINRRGEFKGGGIVIQQFGVQFQRTRFVFFYQIGFELPAVTQSITRIFWAIRIPVKATDVEGQILGFVQWPTYIQVSTVVRVLAITFQAKAGTDFPFKRLSARFGNIIKNPTGGIGAQNRSRTAPYCFYPMDGRIRPEIAVWVD